MNSTAATPGRVTAKAPVSALGVEEIIRNPDAHRGLISVDGVVGAVSAHDRMIALIDTKEYRNCGVTTCAELVLPVTWSGSMPAERQEVRVTGEIQQQGGKLVFKALEILKVDRPKGAAK